jgi:hypothetical protein
VPDNRVFQGEQQFPATRRVVIHEVDRVAVRLTSRLSEAGYIVFGEHIPENRRSDFIAAGGEQLEGEMQSSDPFWAIECLEHDDVLPETLAKIASRSRAYGRPRLELMSANSAPDERADSVVATLAIAASRDPDVVLRVELRVSSRGPQLLVQGNHSLFEETLPMLTVLSDRVLYAGLAHDPDFDGSSGWPQSEEYSN